MWMRYCLGVNDDGETYSLRDPREAEIRTALSAVTKSAAAISQALHGLSAFIPDELAMAPQWRASIEQVLEAILSDGVARTIAREAVEV